MAKPLEFRVSAPGKVILHGEHAVVYGKTAIAASLDLRTTLHFKELPRESDFLGLSLPAVGLLTNVPLSRARRCFFNDEAPKLSSHGHEAFYACVKNFVEEFSCPSGQQRSALEAFFYLLVSIAELEDTDLRPFQVSMESAFPISSGLGSSASFSVCVATAVIHWSHLQKNRSTPMDDEQLAEISRHAYNCEKIMHGNPSGIDNTICTYGSIVEFRRGEKAKVLRDVKSMRCLLVNTRVPKSTKALCAKFVQLKEKYPAIFLPILESIDSVSREALNVIGKIRDLPHESDELCAAYRELMVLIELNQGLLATCQVSHPSLDRICAEAKNYALAAKLTGAGGGGFAYILLLPDTPNETITSITKKLVADGYLVTLTNLGGNRVTIHE